MIRPTGAASNARTPDMGSVAKLASVSAQTVSRVLSGHPNVRSETRARVMAAVEHLGYRPNVAARALASGKSRTLGVFTLESNSYSRATISHGIDVAAREAGYFVAAGSALTLTPHSVTEALDRLADQRVDGIIIAAPLNTVDGVLENLTGRLPTVAIDGGRAKATDVVTVDQYRAGQLATEHLLGLRHSTVWHVAGPREWTEASRRSEGWRDTLVAAGAQIPPLLYGDWTAESGYHNGLILGRSADVTAVFVGSDDMAFGFIRALGELGRRVPEDVAVVGMDDVALAAYCTPPLTTVRQPFATLGRRAVERLLQRIVEPDVALEPELIAPELVVRSSSIPVAQRPLYPRREPSDPDSDGVDQRPRPALNPTTSPANSTPDHRPSSSPTATSTTGECAGLR